ncbi:MAG: hypothetical protein Q9163_000937 [Psora crenata]
MAVSSSLKFCKQDPRWSYEKAFSLSYNPPPGVEKSNVEHESVNLTLTDVRPHKDSLSLDREGFQIVDLESKLEYGDFYDKGQVQRVFAEELRGMLLNLLGAKGVFFHETIRSRHPGFPGTGAAADLKYEQPIPKAHVEQLRILVEEVSGTTISPNARIQAVNVWKPLKGPVRDWPLAVCDASTLNREEDLRPIDSVFAHGYIEGYTVHHNPKQRWCYLSDQQPSELWVFNTADTGSRAPESAGRGRGKTINTLDLKRLETEGRHTSTIPYGCGRHKAEAFATSSTLVQPQYSSAYKKWRELTTVCCNSESLEADDIRYISLNNTLDDVQKQITKSGGGALDPLSHQEFTILSQSLSHLKVFIDAIANEAESGFNPSVFWGFSGLIIKVQSIFGLTATSTAKASAKLAQDEPGAIPRIPRIFRQICHRVEILNSYCIAKSKIIPQMKAACFEIILTIFTLFSSIVKFMRSGSNYSQTGTDLVILRSFQGGGEWQPLEQQASSVIQDLDDAVSRTERITKSTQKAFDFSQLQSVLAMSGLSIQPTTNEPASLPCFVPAPFRIARFFDRSDVIVQIEHFLEKQKTFQSLALWGMGGVGKSSIALRYAETKFHNGELDAMFWVRSEKDVTIRQSFTDIAMRLKLPNTNPADHDENKIVVLNWLQYTKCRWLLIYDNAEDMDLLLSYWPSATRGVALITTRKSSFAFHPASGGLEIPTWDADMGTKFLLHLLSTNISEELTKDETSSANELSRKLSGHALAISQMAALIYRRSWSIAEFVKLYNQQPAKMHGVFGNSSINALWDISFKSLDPQSRAILGIMSFLEPDQISEALFNPDALKDGPLPESLKFTQDAFTFSAVIEDLLTSALIKKDRDRRAFVVHRLVQTAFKYFMTPEERQQRFNDATMFLWNAFPGLDPETQQLYPVWSTCALYLPHALTMLGAFEEEHKANPEFKVLVQYCRLNNNVARYLFETNALHDMMEVTSVNLVALSTKPSMSHHEGIFAEGGLASYRGQLFATIGRYAEACEYLKKSYDFMANDDPYNPQEECLAASNYAHALGSMNNYDAAVAWSEKAIEHWFEHRPDDRQSGEYVPAVKLTLGLPLLFKGDMERAREVLTAGRDQIETSRPYLWQMAARFHYALGTLERGERNLELAEALFMEAQNKWLSNGNIRTDPFNAAIMYKLGCTTLDQGKIEAAVKHLRDAFWVTQIHRTDLKPEHARCMFKLSEALQQEPGNEDEAVFLREEAERLLYESNPDAQNPGLERSYDDLVNLYWR